MTYEDEKRLLKKVLDHLGLKLVYSHKLCLAAADPGQAVVLFSHDGRSTVEFISVPDVLDKVLKAPYIVVEGEYMSKLIKNCFAGMTKEQAAIKLDLEIDI